jgi:hypothetical protein
VENTHNSDEHPPSATWNGVPQFVLSSENELLFVVIRGGNRASRVGFGSDQFDFLEEIGLGRVRLGSGWVGSIYMLCFFRSLIDFDWIEGHLISDRVGSSRIRVGSNQFDFLKKIGSDRIGRVSRVLPPLVVIVTCKL